MPWFLNKYSAGNTRQPHSSFHLWTHTSVLNIQVLCLIANTVTFTAIETVKQYVDLFSPA